MNPFSYILTLAGTLAVSATILAASPFMRQRPATAVPATSTADSNPNDMLYGTAGNTAKALLPEAKSTPVFKAPEEGWRTIVNEDFSGLTEGTEETPSEAMLQGEDFYVSTGILSTDGYSGYGLHSAGGCLAIIPQGQGFLNTPQVNMEGMIHISFKARTYDDIRAITIVPCMDGIGTPTQIASHESLRLFDSDGWVTRDYYFYNPNDADAFMQISTTSYSASPGCLIDDLLIEVNPDYIPPVEKLTASAFTKDGFKASWEGQYLADSYLVSLYKETPVSESNRTASYDFENLSVGEDGTLQGLDQGVTAYLAHPSVAEGETGKAVTFTRHEDYIEFAETGGRITEFSFDQSVLMGDNPSAWGTTIDILGWDGTKWVYIMHDIASYGETNHFDLGGWEEEELGPYEVEERMFRGLYKKVKIVSGSNNFGALTLIDNVHIEYTPDAVMETVVADRKLDAETTEAQFDEYDPAARYYVGVKPASDAYTGEETMIEAYGIAAPVACNAEDVTENDFTAKWEAADKAAAYLLTTYDCLQADRQISGFTVLNDDFSKANVGTDDFSNPVKIGTDDAYSPLDEYTQRPGWVGYGAVAVNGWLGCRKFMFPGLYFLQTPDLSLNNGGGNYIVTFKVKGKEGASMAVMTSELMGMSDPLTNGQEQTVSVEMVGGKTHDYLIFMSSDGSAFFISEITISQDLNEGDIVMESRQAVELTPDVLSQKVAFPDNGTTLRGYDVLAARAEFKRSVVSDYSNPILVTDGSGVEDVNLDKSMFSVEGRHVTVTLVEATRVEMYDIAGNRIVSVDCVPGINDFNLPAEGVYILRIGDATYKMMVK